MESALASTDSSCNHGLRERQETLIATNIGWLRQALSLLETIDDETFRKTPPGLAHHTVGGHLRHILEFYECFLHGVDSAHIDYDARCRDKSIERYRLAAMDRVRTVIERLISESALRGDTLLFVRVEDAAHMKFEDPFLISSIGRELQTLSSHTIHHFALIAMTLRALSVHVSPSFGMAPSTLRFHANRNASAEVA